MPNERALAYDRGARRSIIELVIDCLTVRARSSRIFVGDLLPVFIADVADHGHPFDFTGWTSLAFTLAGPVTITGSATGDAHGVLTYLWTTGQTATPGDYTAYFRGTSPAPESKLRTFEVEGVFRIQPP